MHFPTRSSRPILVPAKSIQALEASLRERRGTTLRLYSFDSYHDREVPQDKFTLAVPQLTDRLSDGFDAARCRRFFLAGNKPTGVTDVEVFLPDAHISLVLGPVSSAYYN